MQGFSILPQGAAPQGIEGLMASLTGANQSGGEGLEGLFAAILNGQTQGDAAPTDLAALLASLKDVAGAELPPELFTTQAEGTLQVDIQAITIHLQQTVVTFQQNAISLQSLGNTSELAMAFTKLGMSPELAAIKAAQIETMLALVSQQLGLESDDDTPGGLLAMIAASSTSLTPMLHQTTVTVDMTQVDIQVVTAAVQRAGVAAFKSQSGKDSLNLARDLTLPQTAVPEGEAALLPAVETPVVNEDILPETEILPQSTLPTETIIPHAAHIVNDASEIQAAATEAAAPILAPEESKRIKPVLSPLDKSQLPQTPQGLEVARVLNDATTGEMTIERKISPSDVRELAPETPPDLTPDAAQTTVRPEGLATAESRTQEADKSQGSASSFAERLAHATRSDATQQTVVHIKQLAGQGGGTVHMILNPPELGEIHIQLTIKADRVEGSISATDNAVVELLARDVHSLRQGLADAGLKLGDQGLALLLNNGNSSMSQQFGGQGQQHPQGQQHQTAQWLDDAASDETINPETWVAVDKLVDVRI